MLLPGSESRLVGAFCHEATCVLRLRLLAVERQGTERIWMLPLGSVPSHEVANESCNHANQPISFFTHALFRVNWYFVRFVGMASSAVVSRHYRWLSLVWVQPELISRNGHTFSTPDQQSGRNKRGAFRLCGL